MDLYGYVYLTHDEKNDIYYVGRHRWSKRYTEAELSLIPEDERLQFKERYGTDIFPLDSEYLGGGSKLNAAIKEHGRQNFTVSLLEPCYSYDSLVQAEHKWLHHYIDLGVPMYNIRLRIDRCGTCRQFDDEGYRAEKRKLFSETARKYNTGKNFGRVDGIHNGRYGKPTSQVTRLRISEKNKGKKRSDEVRARLRAAHDPNNIPPSCKGRIHVTNGVVNKFILPEDFDKLGPGWRRGRTFAKKEGQGDA